MSNMSLPKYKNAQISSISGSKEILVFLDVHLNQSTVTKEKGSFKTGDLLKEVQSIWTLTVFVQQIKVHCDPEHYKNDVMAWWSTQISVRKLTIHLQTSSSVLRTHLD